LDRAAAHVQGYLSQGTGRNRVTNYITAEAPLSALPMQERNK